MDDEFPFADMHPTAGYLFAEELDAHFLALDDFRSTLLQDDAKPVGPFSFISPVAPGSPSSVVYLPPYYLSTGLDDGLFDDDNVFIKPEPMLEVPTTTPAPKLVVRDDCMDADRERLRRRQRGYEKRYRGRKRRDLKLQRDTWLGLEMKLDAARKKHCRPYVVERRLRQSPHYKLLLLLQEERALREDRISMTTLSAWEHISRIREYSDKDELRTASEWRHSADKVVGQCSLLGPRAFNPYAPPKQLHFTW